MYRNSFVSFEPALFVSYGIESEKPTCIVFKLRHIRLRIIQTPTYPTPDYSNSAISNSGLSKLRHVWTKFLDQALSKYMYRLQIIRMKFLGPLEVGYGGVCCNVLILCWLFHEHRSGNGLFWKIKHLFICHSSTSFILNICDSINVDWLKN